MKHHHIINTQPQTKSTSRHHRKASPHVNTPEQQVRLYIEVERHRAHKGSAPSLIISNNIPQKQGNIHIKTSLGVQALSIDNTNQYSIPSSAFGASEGSPSPPTRISNLLNQTDKAARPRTAWRAEADSPHRLTTQANMCKEAQVVQEPQTTFATSTSKERPPAKDKTTHKERPEDLKPRSRNNDP